MQEPLTVWKPNIAGYEYYKWNAHDNVDSYFYAYVGRTKHSATGKSRHRPVKCLGKLFFSSHHMAQRMIPNKNYWELVDKLPKEFR